MNDTPATNARIIVYQKGTTTNFLLAEAADGQGDFRLCLPTNTPCLFKAEAPNYGLRWYSNSAYVAEVPPVDGIAFTRWNVPFQFAEFTEDFDGDGFDEYAETFVMRTDLLNGNAMLRWESLTEQSNGVALRWTARPDVTYWVERCTNLAASLWEAIANIAVETRTVSIVADTSSAPNAAYSNPARRVANRVEARARRRRAG